jgi:hypothetical protein
MPDSRSDIRLNGHRVTGTANGVAANDGAAFGQIAAAITTEESAARTLTNARITSRTLLISGSQATPTINTDLYDVVRITGLTTNITSFTTNLTGTPASGDMLRIYITSGATKLITWGSKFESSSEALLPYEVRAIGGGLFCSFAYNSISGKWRCLAPVTAVTVFKQNTAEGGTDTVTASIANTGGPSGSAFDATTDTWPVFSAAQAFQGSLSYLISGSAFCSAAWITGSSNTTDAYMRAYIYVPAVINSRNYSAGGFSDSLNGTIADAGLMASAGGVLNLHAETNQTSNKATGAVALATATWYRVEAHLSITAAGFIEAWVYDVNGTLLDYIKTATFNATSPIAWVADYWIMGDLFNNAPATASPYYVDAISFSDTRLVGGFASPGPGSFGPTVALGGHGANVDGTSQVPAHADHKHSIAKRVLALSAGSATPAINTDSFDVVHITAQTAAITSFTSGLTGTPVDGDELRISITDNGTARALTWGASFESSTVALPATTVLSARLDVRLYWNTETSKWRCVEVS